MFCLLNRHKKDPRRDVNFIVLVVRRNLSRVLSFGVCESNGRSLPFKEFDSQRINEIRGNLSESKRGQRVLPISLHEWRWLNNRSVNFPSLSFTVRRGAGLVLKTEVKE